MSQLISKFMRWSFLYLFHSIDINVPMERHTFHPHRSDCVWVRETNRANALAMHKRVNVIPIWNWNGLVLRSHAYRISVFMCHIVHVSWTKMFSQQWKRMQNRIHTLYYRRLGMKWRETICINYDRKWVFHFYGKSLPNIQHTYTYTHEPYMRESQ